MKIANNIITNILGKPRVRGGRRDRDGDGVPNKKDCQPRNTMRQDLTYTSFRNNLLSWHPGTPEKEIEIAYNKYKYEIIGKIGK